MSKNLTRKGLALGAIVALGSSLFAGAPAFAAGEISLAPTTGTTYGMISGEVFSLTSATGATVSDASQDKVAFEITNASGLTLSITDPNSEITEAGFLSTATTAQVVRTSSNDGVVELGLAVAATDKGSVTVRSWIDSDQDGVIDPAVGTTPGEFVSDVRTVVFTKLADATFTTTLTQPVLGDTKLAAAVAFSNDLNAAQLASQVTIGFASKAGSTYTATAGSADSDSAISSGSATTYVAASNTLKAESASSPSASTTYVAQAFFNPAGDAANAAKGDESAKAVGAASIVRLTTPSTTATEDVAGSAGNYTVRPGSATIAVSTQAYKDATVSDANKAAAGQVVNVTIEETTATGNTDAATFVAGGKTLQDTTSAADKIEFTATTDATGKVSFSIAVAGTKTAADAIKVSVAAQGASEAAGGNLYATYTFTAATVNSGSLKAANQIGLNAIYKKTAGSTTTLKFAAVDSYGKALGSTYRVLLTDNASTPVVKDATFANGVASFSVTDLTTLSEVYTAQLQEYGSSTLSWSNVANNSLTITPTVGASAAVDKVATLVADNSTALALNLSDLKAVDTRSGGTAPTLTTGTKATLSGTVLDANGIATYGEVTLSATGAMFATDGVYALGSITVQTDANGAFGGVVVYSNTSGDTVVTATSNGKTKTVTLTFASAAATTGAAWSIDAPAYILPGRTLVITPTVTDKYGNKVAEAITFTYEGPGLPISSTTPTSANVAYRVLLGAGDTGTATVKVWIDKDGDSAKDDGESYTSTIVIGAAPVVAPTAVVAISGSTGKVYVSVTNAAGKKVVVKVSAKFAKSFTGTLAKKTQVVATTKGSKKITVYVGGKLVATKTVTVK